MVRECVAAAVAVAANDDDDVVAAVSALGPFAMAMATIMTISVPIYRSDVRCLCYWPVQDLAQATLLAHLA